jgi:hypothetical protein
MEEGVRSTLAALISRILNSPQITNSSAVSSCNISPVRTVPTRTNLPQFPAPVLTASLPACFLVHLNLNYVLALQRCWWLGMQPADGVQKTGPEVECRYMRKVAGCNTPRKKDAIIQIICLRGAFLVTTMQWVFSLRLDETACICVLRLDENACRRIFRLDANAYRCIAVGRERL